MENNYINKNIKKIIIYFRNNQIGNEGFKIFCT